MGKNNPPAGDAMAVRNVSFADDPSSSTFPLAYQKEMMVGIGTVPLAFGGGKIRKVLWENTIRPDRDRIWAEARTI